jgi:hypothetical protein
VFLVSLVSVSGNNKLLVLWDYWLTGRGVQSIGSATIMKYGPFSLLPRKQLRELNEEL